MKTEKQVINRLFLFNTFSLVLTLLLILSMAKTMFILRNEQAYNEFLNNPMNLNSEYKQFETIEWYHYAYFGLASLFWLYWLDYVYYLYLERKKLK